MANGDGKELMIGEKEGKDRSGELGLLRGLPSTTRSPLPPAPAPAPALASPALRVACTEREPGGGDGEGEGVNVGNGLPNGEMDSESLLPLLLRPRPPPLLRLRLGEDIVCGGDGVGSVGEIAAAGPLPLAPLPLLLPATRGVKLAPAIWLTEPFFELVRDPSARRPNMLLPLLLGVADTAVGGNKPPPPAAAPP